MKDEHKHKWSAPVIAMEPIYNDFGTPIQGVGRPVAYISCGSCGEIKKK